MTIQPRLLNLKQAAAYLSISVSTFRRQVMKRVKPVRLSPGRLTFDIRDLDAFIEKVKEEGLCLSEEEKREAALSSSLQAIRNTTFDSAEVTAPGTSRSKPEQQTGGKQKPSAADILRKWRGASHLPVGKSH